MKQIFIINARGQKESFSAKKTFRSARRAGASSELAQSITDTIKREVYPGIKTSVIFKRIKQLLQKKSPVTALRFNIKEGMRKLGPTGFPFEKYIGEVLKSLGYKVSINQFLPGKCLNSYEIDFIAEKGNIVFVGECKYRNVFGERVHSSDALENRARFFDIMAGSYFKSVRFQSREVRSMMVTNTKLTNRAQKYSLCSGTEILGWNYPINKGLEYLIEKEKLYPITILPSLTSYLKDIFVAKKIMLVQDVLKQDLEFLAQKLNVPSKNLSSLVREAEVLMKE